MNNEFATYPSLKNKTVIVTGGASGIGRQIVEAFDAQGAKVGFVDLDGDAGRKVAAGLKGEHAFAQCDLRDIDALRAGFAAIAEKLGPASVLVNNAARDERNEWGEVTPK